MRKRDLLLDKRLALETGPETDYLNIFEQVGPLVQGHKHEHENEHEQKYEPGVVPGEKTVDAGIKRVLILEGLACAGCAAKIEAQAREIPGVKNAAVDFVTKKLTLEAADKKEFTRIFTEVTAIVRKLEPDVKVILGADPAGAGINETEIRRNRKKEINRLVLGGVLFAAGLVFKSPDWLGLIIFLASYIIVGGRVVLGAVKRIARGDLFNEYFLMSVATIGAFAIGEYAEGVAVMLFYLLGEVFENMAVDHSRKSIGALMDIRPDYANLKAGDELKRVSPEAVRVGDIILVKPGEKVPLDGKVIEGTSLVDTAALTGESVPRELEPGSEVLSGFINKSGVLTIEVTKEFGESTVVKILDLVENAGSRKAPTEKFITKFARYYTPVVVFGALALAVIPPLVVPGATFSQWVYRALVFLVVSCPCALVLSIPLGFIGGIGGAAKKGILVKGGNYLEALNHVEAVVFDKTGTLTKGLFQVTQVNPENGFTGEELLEYAAYAESYSNHPIAHSIIRAYKGEIEKNRVTGYQEVAGQGIKAIVDGKEVLAGNTRLMASEDINYNDVDTLGTVVHVGIDKKYAGNIVIADEVKEDAANAIKELKALGVAKTVMLTGDVKPVAEKIGEKLGIDDVHSQLLPADKVEKIEDLEGKKSRKGKIVFVGDGINDAPVLARADIGMAMGGLGSDAAIEAADVVIMTDEPSKIAAAIKIARRTRRIVTQNILFAVGIKAVFLVLGALGVATMWEAVFADVGVTIIAVLNAMRLLNGKN